MSEGESLDELMKELRSSVEENMERLISCKRTLNDILSVGQIGQKKRRKEETGRNLSCKVCNRKFTTRRGLNRHKSIHSATKSNSTEN
jgi:hypothetical protein